MTEKDMKHKVAKGLFWKLLENGGAQAVENRHVAVDRRHMTAVVLLEGHQRVIGDLAAVDGFDHGLRHDAVHRIGNTGHSQTFQQRPQVPHRQRQQGDHPGGQQQSQQGCRPPAVVHASVTEKTGTHGLTSPRHSMRREAGLIAERLRCP